MTDERLVLDLELKLIHLKYQRQVIDNRIDRLTAKARVFIDERKKVVNDELWAVVGQIEAIEGAINSLTPGPIKGDTCKTNN